MEELEQAKRRNRKIYITNVAIDKIPLIKYRGFTETQNKIMRELAQEVLTVSKEINESNEVAITCDLGVQNPPENYGVALGTEHEVNVLADTLSNQGTVHYLKRDKDYNVKHVIELFKECIDGLEDNSPVTEVYLASLSFLAKCSEVGLYYR